MCLVESTHELGNNIANNHQDPKILDDFLALYFFHDGHFCKVAHTLGQIIHLTRCAQQSGYFYNTIGCA